MQIKIKKISEIKPYPKNPRRNDRAVPALVQSIKQFGFQQPIVIDRNGVIVAGHTRYKAAQELRLASIPVVEARDSSGKWLSEAKCRAYRIADNRTNENAGWEDELLMGELAGLKIEIPGIALNDLTAFTEGEIRKLFPESNDRSDDVPDIRQTKIKPGDIINLGVHRLMCGDTTKPETLAEIMGNERADMVFTDPPYGVAIGKKNRMMDEIGKKTGNSKDIENDELPPDELRGVLLSAMSNVKNYLGNCCSVFVCAPQGGELSMMMMMMMMRDAGLKTRHVIIWKKNQPTFSLGRLDYDYAHEPILFTWTKTHRFYGQGSQRTSVWEFDKPRESKLHPTMKPVALIENALLNNSAKGDIVLDGFGGAGSTLIACENLGRRARIIEIDPAYCQVIVDRYEQHIAKRNEAEPAKEKALKTKLKKYHN